MISLSPAETLALAKAVSTTAAKAARGDLSPGTHRVDFLVHVRGDLTVGIPYSRRIPAKADPWAILAAALSRLNGVTVEALVREALTADRIIMGESIKDEAIDAIQRLKDSTDTECQGRVKGALDVALAAGGAFAVTA